MYLWYAGAMNVTSFNGNIQKLDNGKFLVFVNYSYTVPGTLIEYTGCVTFCRGADSLQEAEDALFERYPKMKFVFISEDQLHRQYLDLR